MTCILSYVSTFCIYLVQNYVFSGAPAAVAAEKPKPSRMVKGELECRIMPKVDKIKEPVIGELCHLTLYR